VLVVLVSVAAVSLSGSDAGPLDIITGDDTPATPEFAFHVGKVKAVETATKPNHQQAVDSAQGPAEAVTEQLDRLYTAAFLDPGNWAEGSYDDVLAFFAGGARDAAEKQLDVLTAGPAAGDAFEAIAPKPSSLKIQVLLDPDGVPRSAEGSARFRARGTGATGQVSLVSTGEFILEKVDGEWLVVSFSVRRSDDERELDQGSPSATDASESASEDAP